ncbi:MAG: hypothetical protein ACFFDK_17740 [Promethearchaeota archaeon]
MIEAQKEYMYDLTNRMLDSLIIEKKKNPKNLKKFKNFDAKINLGLQTDKNSYTWFNLVFNKGNHQLNKGDLKDDYDLVLKFTPEDLIFFCNGENSIVHMLLKKNKFGNRKLRFSKGTTGRNFFKLLKLPKLLVMDKKRPI